MKTLPLICFAALLAGSVTAKEKARFDKLELEDGMVLKNAVVIKVEPDGLRIEHSAGVSKVKFEELPAAIQKEFTFDRDEAAKFREEQEAAKAVRDAADRKVRVEAVLEQRRGEQESDVQKGREAFFRLLESGEYSYPQLDKSLLDSISILKEAGRKDLAAMLEDDRKLLRERELMKPADKYRLERDQLLARIKDLENQVAQLNGGANPPANPPDNDNRVIHETGVIPIFVDRPVVIDRPVPVERPGSNRPCPPGTGTPIRPAIPDSTHPARPAPANPPRAFQPSPPMLPQPSAPSFTPPRPSLPAAPSTPVPSTTVSLPSSGAPQQGAHPWKR